MVARLILPVTVTQWPVRRNNGHNKRVNIDSKRVHGTDEMSRVDQDSNL